MEEKEYVQQLRDGRVFFDYGPVSMVVSALRGGRPDRTHSPQRTKSTPCG